MEQIIDKIYNAVYDAYMTERNSEVKAMYDSTLTILANLDLLIPNLSE